MLDLYALPGDVPGVDESRGLPPYKRVAAIESAIANVFNDERLRPYVQLHEFEALVFTAPDTAATRAGTAAVGAMMSEAVRRAGGVELIDEGPSTAPSNRIKSVWPGYVKTIDGPAIAGLVGLEGLRGSCPHFAAWLGWLEGL